MCFCAQVKGSAPCDTIPVRHVSIRFSIMVLLILASSSPFSNYASQSVLMFMVVSPGIMSPFVRAYCLLALLGPHGASERQPAMRGV